MSKRHADRPLGDISESVVSLTLVFFLPTVAQGLSSVSDAYCWIPVVYTFHGLGVEIHVRGKGSRLVVYLTPVFFLPPEAQGLLSVSEEYSWIPVESTFHEMGWECWGECLPCRVSVLPPVAALGFSSISEANSWTPKSHCHHKMLSVGWWRGDVGVSAFFVASLAAAKPQRRRQ